MKLRNWVRRNKEVILVVGGITLVGFGMYVISKKILTPALTQPPNIDTRDVIRWHDTGKRWDLEDVLKVLEANKTSNAIFAIFRNGSVDPSKYDIIALNGTEILSEAMH